MVIRHGYESASLFVPFIAQSRGKLKYSLYAYVYTTGQPLQADRQVLHLSVQLPREAGIHGQLGHGYESTFLFVTSIICFAANLGAKHYGAIARRHGHSVLVRDGPKRWRMCTATGYNQSHAPGPTLHGDTSNFTSHRNARSFHQWRCVRRELENSGLCTSFIQALTSSASARALALVLSTGSHGDSLLSSRLIQLVRGSADFAGSAVPVVDHLESEHGVEDEA